MLRILNHSDSQDLITRKSARLAEAERVVAPILEAVRTRGDAGLFEYAAKFDGLDPANLKVTRAECDAARAQCSQQFLAAVETAAGNIRAYAETQLPPERSVDYGDGRVLGQIVRPLESMGAYIPAGRYPLPSTLLMTAIPAQVAGVRRIVVTCPKPSIEILAICSILNLSHVYRIGGAQAIAALAYGTESIASVDRIVGPGNIYVAAAKKMIAGSVGIDFIAGPTEIVVIAATGNAAHIAADMLAQAEHDTDASAILLTTSRALAESVAAEIERQLVTLSTADVARVAICNNSAAVIVESLDQAVHFSNLLAPEHLALHDSSLLAGIRNAGSVFLGPYSPEAAGDYASGPNHVLPTSGAARQRGGLSAADFVKVISVQELSREGLRSLAPAITTLARAEGLEAHARSVEVRNA